MDKTARLARLLTQRESLYLFLSDAYLFEVDAARLAAMRRMEFPTGVAEEPLAEGYRLLADFLAGADATVLDDLAVDYARVFLAAGVAQGLAAFPYQSVYTDGQRMMAQQPAGLLAALYAAKGLQANPDNYRTPDDHIGLILAYMARLCAQMGEALQQKDAAKFAQLAKEQAAFLQAHLLNWYGGFCRDVQRYAATGFYKAITQITAGFCTLEGQLMENGGALWDIA